MRTSNTLENFMGNSSLELIQIKSIVYEAQIIDKHLT